MEGGVWHERARNLDHFTRNSKARRLGTSPGRKGSKTSKFEVKNRIAGYQAYPAERGMKNTAVYEIYSSNNRNSWTKILGTDGGTSL